MQSQSSKSYTYRQLRETERGLACLKVRLQKARTEAKIVSQLVNVDHAVNAMMSGEVEHVVINDELLLAYSVGSPWYSDNLVVQELLVLRLYDGPTGLEAVADTLERIKQNTNAAMTIVGGAFSDKPAVLARAYRRLGFTEDNSPELYRR